MLGFGNSKANGSVATSKMTDRDLLEAIHKDLKDIKMRLSDLEEAFGVGEDNENGGEFAAMKAELKEDKQFLKELVNRSMAAMEAKANKPTAAELHAAKSVTPSSALSVKEANKLKLPG